MQWYDKLPGDPVISNISAFRNRLLLFLFTPDKLTESSHKNGRIEHRMIRVPTLYQLRTNSPELQS